MSYSEELSGRNAIGSLLTRGNNAVIGRSPRPGRNNDQHDTVKTPRTPRDRTGRVTGKSQILPSGVDGPNPADSY